MQSTMELRCSCWVSTLKPTPNVLVQSTGLMCTLFTVLFKEAPILPELIMVVDEYPSVVWIYLDVYILVAATDVVTVYVFQEPSLLSSLQDNGLTDVVLHALLVKDVSMPSFLLPWFKHILFKRK
jgi:hypothetical protein